MAGKRKLILGVGINDVPYITQTHAVIGGVRKMVWVCPYYTRWRCILRRCFDRKLVKVQKTYEGVSICPEWLRLSNFREWCIDQENKYSISISDNDLAIDKDILYPGNKIYCGERCAIVSRRVNNLLVCCANRRGEYPLGVHLDKRRGMFMAQCSGVADERLYLGYYTDPYLAHRAWQLRKAQVIEEVALEQANPDIRIALLRRVACIKDDIFNNRITTTL